MSDPAPEVRIERNRRVPTYLKQSILQVDDSYQSPVNAAWVREIADGFDPDLFHPLVVSARADGTFWVVDGRHRLEAIRMLGWLDQALPCWVFRGLSVAEEARLFVRLTSGVRKKRADRVFRARVTAGEPIAHEIARVTAECGYRLASSRGPRSDPGVLGCTGTLEDIWRAGGTDLLHRVLSLVHDTWGGRPKSTDADFVKAVSAFVLVHPEASRKVFSERLSRHEPQALLVEGRAFSRATANRAIHGYYYVLVQHYNFRAKSDDRLVPVTSEQYGTIVRQAVQHRRYGGG